MSDYKSAFSEGLEAAKNAAVARLEIDNVFQDLNKQLAEVSGGKLTIERELLERPRNWIQQMTISALTPPERYWAITARNPIIKDSPSQKLCDWESGRAGYPCKLTWGGEEHYCEDKQALEIALSNLLRDPIIAEKLISLMESRK